MAAGDRKINIIVNLVTKGIKRLRNLRKSVEDSNKAISNSTRKRTRELDRSMARQGKNIEDLGYQRYRERLGLKQLGREEMTLTARISKASKIQRQHRESGNKGLEKATDMRRRSLLFDRQLVRSEMGTSKAVVKEGTKRIKSTEKQMKTNQKELQSEQERMRLIEDSRRGLWGVFGMERKKWSEQNTAVAQYNKNVKDSSMQLDVFSTRGGRWANRIRMMTHGLKGFRMEFLATMFFGMNLSRMFGQFTDKAYDMLGFVDYFNTMMTLTILDTIEPFVDNIYGMIDGFFEATESVNFFGVSGREMLGTLTIIGKTFGDTLFMVSSLMLGIGGLIQVFALLGPAGKSAVMAISKPFIGLIGALPGIGPGIAAAFSGITKALFAGELFEAVGGQRGGIVPFAPGWSPGSWSKLMSKEITVFGKTITASSLLKAGIFVISLGLLIDSVAKGEKLFESMKMQLAAVGITYAVAPGFTLPVAIVLLFGKDAFNIGKEIGKMIPKGIKEGISEFLMATPFPTIYANILEYLGLITKEEADMVRGLHREKTEELDKFVSKTIRTLAYMEKANKAYHEGNTEKAKRAYNMMTTMWSSDEPYPEFELLETSSSEAWDSMKDTFQSGFTDLNTTTRTGGYKVRKSAKSFWDSISKDLEDLEDKLGISGESAMDNFKTAIHKGATETESTVKDHKTTFKNAVDTTFFNPLKDLHSNSTTWLKSLVDWYEWALNAIESKRARITTAPTPSLGDIMENIFGFRFPGFQRGGIVTSPTLALLGERGPEAVIPLEEKGKAGSYNTTININVDRIGSDIDMKDLAERVNSELQWNYRRSTLR